MSVKRRRRTVHKKKIEYHSSSSEDESPQDENNLSQSEVVAENEDHNEISDEEEIGDSKDGWADAMSKVLSKTGPKDAQTLILPKEKFPQEKTTSKSNKLEMKKKLQLKKEWEDMGHKKPNILEKDYERALQKIATRGVIQLFNAVKKHQNEMGEKLKSAKTEQKKEKLYKNLDRGKFLRMLRGDEKSNPTDDDKTEPTPEQPAWKVLRDDYMEGKGMVDWDKETSDQESAPKKKRKVR